MVRGDTIFLRLVCLNENPYIIPPWAENSEFNSPKEMSNFYDIEKGWHKMCWSCCLCRLRPQVGMLQALEGQSPFLTNWKPHWLNEPWWERRPLRWLLPGIYPRQLWKPPVILPPMIHTGCFSNLKGCLRS